ncbi:hypothetical protein H696_04370 [Fonticula alba]|uniref:NLE domain-containing protein n=1 Tax=Fonticula alba TaxID=691883 RepID=A0A058Z4A6_FONAL|nr:hypothetical protein H696_04370 [Fonticula alba]KCV68951.1 hypothetical protein H696_04370 [Fonticula alba]|eukprot:XP_009496522.1 hypothetical protein H696_04370 [Fonticula alba]
MSLNMSADTPQEGQQIQARFVAATTSAMAAAVPLPTIAIPASLRRYGLSEILNHLLANATPRPYDFIINGHFLRTSIAEWIKANDESSENVITIEYVESLTPPKTIEQPDDNIHDDWVSSIVATPSLTHAVSGSYDSQLRLWNAQGQVAGRSSTTSEHLPKRSIKAITAFQLDGLDYVASASKDQNAHVWSLPSLTATSKDVSLSPCVTLVGDGHSVEAITASPCGQRIATGYWNGAIRIWDMLAANDLAQVAPSSKKRKTPATPADRPHVDLPHLIELSGGHSAGPITALHWTTGSTGVEDDEQYVAMDMASGSLYSGSWDESLLEWNVAMNAVTHRMHSPYPISTLSHSPFHNLVATGHADIRSIQLWDPRIKDTNVCQRSLTGHTGTVTSVSWSPELAALGPAPLLASASRDGTIRIWDMRATIPLFTLQAHKGAVGLAVNWLKDTVVSGGSDGRVKFHTLSPDTSA